MKKTVFILVISLLIFSCSNDDDATPSDSPFSKAWFMESYGGFGPTFDFSESYILYDFSQSNTTVQVVNYTSEDEFYLPSGIYDYHVVGNTVIIDDQTFDYSVEDGILTLSDMPEVDGVVIQFISKENDCVVDPFEELTWLSDARDTIRILGCPGISGIEQYTKDGTCIYQIQLCASATNSNLNFYESDGNLLCEDIAIGEEIDCLGMTIDMYKKRDLMGLYNVINPILCDQTTIINNDQYMNTDLAVVTINAIEIVGDCLNITYSASGCDGNSWEVKLIDSGDVAESNPLQRFLKLSLINNEACTAYITKQTSFDISNLQVQQENQIQLNIVNTQTEILYEY